MLVKSVDAARVRARVGEYARQLFLSHPEVEEIVVFGSFANETYAPGSDIDLLIVLSRSDRPFRDRIAEFLPGGFPVGLDLFPYTREELASRVSSGFLAAAQGSDWRYQRPPKS